MNDWNVLNRADIKIIKIIALNLVNNQNFF